MGDDDKYEKIAAQLTEENEANALSYQQAKDGICLALAEEFLTNGRFQSDIADALGQISMLVYGLNLRAGWWTNLKTGKRAERNIGELLMLGVSELAEAMEGDRKNLMDDKLPAYKMFDVELADALIRIFDMAGGLNCETPQAFVEKLIFNAHRSDHKPENRVKDNGKKY